MKEPQLDAWVELLRVLENVQVHHSKARFLVKEELWEVYRALYNVAIEVLHDDQA